MKLVFQVLSPADFDEVFTFADTRLRGAIQDDTQRMFASWTAKWRREALEHYLKTGWSFIVRDEDDAQATGNSGSNAGRIVGFFLAQPLLFFRGQTQSLWVEHVEAETDEAMNLLVDVAIRVAREKHLQRALFADADRLESMLSRWSPEMLSNEPIAIVMTTKG